ncbi:hypothetical protein [Pseudoalteromonas aliena]|uniref:hypothetical protein n=1 Tax=Pseudoalteromonas aliena TaxID=247523 RepID=UPI0012FBB27B|nr:hypothetical protein [Pseudoalteromonas aliena]
MSLSDDRQLSNEERAELAKRKFEMSSQKKTKQASSLSDLKKELGLPETGAKK